MMTLPETGKPIPNLITGVVEDTPNVAYPLYGRSKYLFIEFPNTRQGYS